MYFLHAINSDRQTQLLNVFGQIAMILGDKKNQIINKLGTSLNVKKILYFYRTIEVLTKAHEWAPSQIET